MASNATLTYTPRLGDDHSLTVLGGWNIEDYTYKSNLMNREGIIIPGMPNFSLLEGEAITLKDNGSYDWGLVGAFYRISYSYKGILQMPYNDLHFVSDYARHMELINESCDNIGTSRIFSQSNIDLWREKSADPYGVGENGVPNFALYPNTDWFDEIFENGYSQEHNLSISGGSEKIRSLLSLGYLDNQGVMGICVKETV